MFARAARTGDTETLVQLYVSGAITPDSRTSFIGLHVAIMYGHMETVKYLLGKNIPVPRGSLTPLMSAASSGQMDILRLLLDRGASINDTNPNGDTALSLARRSKQAAAIEMLLQNGAKE